MADDPTVFTLLSAVAAQGAGTGVPFGGAGGAQVHVYSAAGSSCTVLIQGSQDNSVWITLVTLTDPAAAPAGFVYQGVAFPYMRANVSAYVSGTITAKAVALDESPGHWAPVTYVAATSGALTVDNLTDSGLTATRVPYASTAGLLVDSSKMSYDDSYLTVPNLKNTAATATRVPFYGASKELDDDSTFVWDDTNKRLSATEFKGNHIMAASAKATDGAIAAAPATIFITKGSALGSSTVANPTATTHDGYRIKIVSTTAYAHVVSFNSGKINGGSLTTATFGAAIGNTLCVVAYQGVWYAVENIGVTIS